MASQIIKEFNKCLIDKTNFIVDGSNPNYDRLISIGAAIGYDESILKANVDKCKSIYTGAYTLDEHWSMYACLFSF